MVFGLRYFVGLKAWDMGVTKIKDCFEERFSPLKQRNQK
jgi:hypothetical protein